MPYADKARQREYQRLWVARNRADWILAHGPCTACGSWNSLEVDHIDPSQKVNHRIWSWSPQRREAELAKCRVLCRKCHEERHAVERRPATHGSLTMYKNHQCRCTECRSANARQVRLQRERGTK